MPVLALAGEDPGICIESDLDNWPGGITGGGPCAPMPLGIGDSLDLIAKTFVHARSQATTYGPPRASAVGCLGRLQCACWSQIWR